MYRRFRERPLPQEALPIKLPVLGLDVDRKEAGLTDQIQCISRVNQRRWVRLKHPGNVVARPSPRAKQPPETTPLRYVVVPRLQLSRPG